MTASEGTFRTASTSRCATPKPWPMPAHDPRSEPSETPTTTRWLRRSTASTKPSWCTAAGPGGPSNNSNWRPWNGSGGTTPPGCTPSLGTAAQTSSSKITTLTNNHWVQHPLHSFQPRNETQCGSPWQREFVVLSRVGWALGCLVPGGPHRDPTNSTPEPRWWTRGMGSPAPLCIRHAPQPKSIASASDRSRRYSTDGFRRWSGLVLGGVTHASLRNAHRDGRRAVARPATT